MYSWNQCIPPVPLPMQSDFVAAIILNNNISTLEVAAESESLSLIGGQPTRNVTTSRDGSERDAISACLSRCAFFTSDCP